MSDIVWLLKFTSPDDYEFCYEVMCEAAEEIERLRQENSSLRWKNPHPNVSEADFVKWQQHRQQQEDTIKTLTERIGELYDEVRYWQQQAMRSVIRD